MQAVTIRDLRYDFAKVEAWLAGGEKIQVTKHGRPVAILSPPLTATKSAFDIQAHRTRMEATWGGQVFTDEEIRSMRDAELGERS